MIIQVILILGLLACVLYAYLQRQRSRFISWSLVLVSFAGMFFVLFPDSSNQLAHLVGVGRGADLILYLWLLISLLILFNLHLKLRSQMELITELAREVALLRTELSRQDTRSGNEKMTPPGQDG